MKKQQTKSRGTRIRNRSEVQAACLAYGKRFGRPRRRIKRPARMGRMLKG